MAEPRTHAGTRGLRHRPELLGISIARLSRSANRHIATKLRDHRIGAGQHAVLLALFREGSLRQDELAATLDVDQAHVTRMLQHLAQAGYVIRSVDPTDARARRAVLTETGKQAVPHVEEAMRSWNTRVLGALSGTQADELLELLSLVADTLNQEDLPNAR